MYTSIKKINLISFALSCIALFLFIVFDGEMPDYKFDNFAMFVISLISIAITTIIILFFSEKKEDIIK